MIRNKGYKYRLYPNREQQRLINKIFGCVRFCWNFLLSEHTKRYKRRKESMSQLDMQHEIERIKEFYPWLRETDSQALAYVSRQLDDAFKRFYKHQCGYPKYKSKKCHYDSYTTTQKVSLKYKHGYVKLPHLGWVRCRGGRDIPDASVIQKMTVSRDPSGRYYVSVLVREEIQPLPLTSGDVGIDVGIHTFTADSDGCIVDNPRILDKKLKALRRANKALARTKTGSHNHEKARIRLAICHRKVKDTRYDFHHKVSKLYIDENQVMSAESLDVKSMLGNKYLARHIADCGWAEFLSMLEYKADWYGRTFTKIDKDFKSTQTCHVCGHVNEELEGFEGLHIREWTCPECHTHHDRDNNASINIKIEGHRLRSVA